MTGAKWECRAQVGAGCLLPESRPRARLGTLAKEGLIVAAATKAACRKSAMVVSLNGSAPFLLSIIGLTGQVSVACSVGRGGPLFRTRSCHAQRGGRDHFVITAWAFRNSRSPRCCWLRKDSLQEMTSSFAKADLIDQVAVTNRDVQQKGGTSPTLRYRPQCRRREGSGMRSLCVSIQKHV
jgi:hypothetical protein